MALSEAMISENWLLCSYCWHLDVTLFKFVNNFCFTVLATLSLRLFILWIQSSDFVSKAVDIAVEELITIATPSKGLFNDYCFFCFHDKIFKVLQVLFISISFNFISI